MSHGELHCSPTHSIIEKVSHDAICIPARLFGLAQGLNRRNFRKEWHYTQPGLLLLLLLDERAELRVLCSKQRCVGKGGRKSGKALGSGRAIRR